MTTSQDIRAAANAPRVTAPEGDKPVKATATSTPRVPKAKTEPGPCQCEVPDVAGTNGGCAGAKTNRLFAPGHDAKLVGYLTREVVAGRLTQEQAVAEIGKRSKESVLLISKLTSAIPREMDKAKGAAKRLADKAAAKAEKEKASAFAREQAEAVKADKAAKAAAEAK